MRVLRHLDEAGAAVRRGELGFPPATWLVGVTAPHDPPGLRPGGRTHPAHRPFREDQCQHQPQDERHGRVIELQHHVSDRARDHVLDRIAKLLTDGIVESY